MPVKLNTVPTDIHAINEAMSKKGGMVKTPYDNVIKVFMDHGKLAAETNYGDFQLSEVSLDKLGTILGGKVGKTGLVSIKRMFLTHLLEDHEAMMGMVEQNGEKYSLVI